MNCLPFWAIFANVLIQVILARERGILSNVWGNKPPIESTDDNSIGPDDIDDDGCARTIPLTPRNKQQLALAFKRSKLVTDILPVAPDNLLEVTYDDLDRCQPYLGNDVDICGVTKPPIALKWKCNPLKNYTLHFVDIYPTGIKNRYPLASGLLWWLVDISNCDFTRGRPLMEYQQPLPLYGSGKNIYFYGIFEQPQYEQDFSEEPYVSATSEKYRYYRCPNIIVKYDLKLVAGNFFYSSFQPCVEEGLDKLDKPSPQYVIKGEESANLPADPHATSARKFDVFRSKRHHSNVMKREANL